MGAGRDFKSAPSKWRCIPPVGVNDSFTWWQGILKTEESPIRAYLRASTDEQDAGRARASLEKFASDHNKVIACEYLENASGAASDRPELLRLLNDARKGDVLLVESIDRLSRLPADDWAKLKGAIDAKGLRIVALDLPTSYQGMRDTKGDEFTDRMLAAINSMLVEMMAAIARKRLRAAPRASGSRYREG